MTSPNPESILDSVKKTLGMDPDFAIFDLDVIMFINAAFGSLQQFGVGSDTGFIISDNTALWSQYTSQLLYLGMVKSYIFMTVKLAFDPPATSFAIDAIKGQITELGWRINVAVEQINPPSNPLASSSRNQPCETGDEENELGIFKTYFAPAVVQLEFFSIVTPDASKGNMFYLTLTADCTINALVNGVDGQHITLDLTSNGHSVTWGNGWDFGSAGIPDLSSGGQADVISAYYKESATTWRSGYINGF